MPRAIYDLLIPCLDPQDVCAFLKIKGNYLGHDVQVTIGAPSLPPAKRGQKGKYSCKDAILIDFGRKFIRLGITPNRIKACVTVFRDKWSDIAPSDWIDFERAEWGGTGDDHFFLYGTEDGRGFYAEAIPREELMENLRSKNQGSAPYIGINLTIFCASAAIDLLRVLAKRQKIAPRVG